jgi:hypothetical protein
LSSFSLVLSSFSKYFLGGFEGFQGDAGQKFAFLEESRVSSNFRGLLTRDALRIARGDFHLGEINSNTVFLFRKVTKRKNPLGARRHFDLPDAAGRCCVKANLIAGGDSP